MWDQTRLDEVVLLAAAVVSRGEPKARTEKTIADFINKICVQSFYYCESSLHLPPSNRGGSLQFDDELVSLVRCLEALCVGTSTSVADAVFLLSSLATVAMSTELGYEDVECTIAGLRLLVDPEDQPVVIFVHACKIHQIFCSLLYHIYFYFIVCGSLGHVFY
jgi:hypothetical protein